MQAEVSLGTRTGNSKIWAYGFGASGIAAVLNVIVLLIGKAAGVPFLVPAPGNPGTLETVTPFIVIVSTVAALGIGVLGTALLAPKLRNGLFKFQVLAAALTVLSLLAPLAQTEGATTAWLSAMHLISGATFIIGLQRAKQSEQ
ncbi:MAG: DUF6069 family protein [Actinomycetota bacterium]